MEEFVVYPAFSDIVLNETNFLPLLSPQTPELC